MKLGSEEKLALAGLRVQLQEGKPDTAELEASATVESVNQWMRLRLDARDPFLPLPSDDFTAPEEIFCDIWSRGISPRLKRIWEQAIVLLVEDAVADPTADWVRSALRMVEAIKPPAAHSVLFAAVERVVSSGNWLPHEAGERPLVPFHVQERWCAALAVYNLTEETRAFWVMVFKTRPYLRTVAYLALRSDAQLAFELFEMYVNQLDASQRRYLARRTIARLVDAYGYSAARRRLNGEIRDPNVRLMVEERLGRARFAWTQIVLGKIRRWVRDIPQLISARPAGVVGLIVSVCLLSLALSAFAAYQSQRVLNHMVSKEPDQPRGSNPLPAYGDAGAARSVRDAGLPAVYLSRYPQLNENQIDIQQARRACYEFGVAWTCRLAGLRQLYGVPRADGGESFDFGASARDLAAGCKLREDLSCRLLWSVMRRRRYLMEQEDLRERLENWKSGGCGSDPLICQDVTEALLTQSGRDAGLGTRAPSEGSRTNVGGGDY